MGGSLNADKGEEPNTGSGEAENPNVVIKRQMDARGEREKGLFKKDVRECTPLFYAAKMGLEEEVRGMNFNLPGNGLSLARNALISLQDKSGLTVADLADKNGHLAFAMLLAGEQGRMDFFE